MNQPEAANYELLAKNVKQFYFAHFSALTLEQKVHFAWSLYMWNGDPQAYQYLMLLKPQLTGDGDVKKLYQRLAAESASNTHGKGKWVNIHVKYFLRHPGLLVKTWQLVYLLRLRTIYGIDTRAELLQNHSIDDFRQTLARLEADPEAIAMLPAAAINYIYLVNHLLLERPDDVDPTTLLRRSRLYYNLKDSMHLKALSYLYTHFVIGESLFFSRPIPAGKLATYQSLMQQAEKVISRYYFEHGLDNKYEFLACARLVGNKPRLEAVINSEARNSFVDGSVYTADLLNRNPNKHLPNIGNMAHAMAFFVLYNSKKLYIPTFGPE